MPIKVRRPLLTRIASGASICLALFSLSSCSDAKVTSANPITSVPVANQAAPALTQAIQGIDAAIYGYGVIGAYVSGSSQKKAERAIATLNRQRLTFELTLGMQINEVAVAYQLPTPVTNAESAKKLAELLEMKLVALFDDVAKSSTGVTKTAAELASSKATNRAASWITTPVPNPTF